jgi:hypothetical protein
MNPYFGKYRGTVTNNVDPNRMGRLQVSCPEVLELNALAWAMPSVPFAGANEGFYMMPSVTSNVWVEFEAGDPERPIWSGCFWTTQTIPAHAMLPTVRTIATTSATITLDDTPGTGGVTLSLGPAGSPPTCTISCGVTGIDISMGANKVAVRVDGVDVNNGALKVM